MESDWREGRVIVDLGVLFDSLICQSCLLSLFPSQCKGLHGEGVSGNILISAYSVV